MPLGEPLFNRGGGVNRLTNPSPSHDIPGTPANYVHMLHAVDWTRDFARP